MKKTLIIGPIHTEVLSYYHDLPKGNEEATPFDTKQIVGGSGYITARTLHGVGFPYHLLAPLGTGIYADFVKDACKELGMSYFESDSIAGSTYRMVDDEGKENMIRVPGGEYDFPYEMVSDLDLSEYDHPIVYGDMFLGENPSEIIAFLYDLDLPFTFIPNGCWDEIDEDLQEAIIDLEPTFILSDTEAYYMMNEDSEDLLECAKDIHHFTKAPVILIKQEDGCLYYDGKQSLFAPEKERLNFSAFTAVFMTARTAGIDVKNAMMLANEYAVRFAYDDTNKAYYDTLKEALAKTILNK